ncbi:unnamed protein product [Heterobilharzia americana]|nr:unnamed protein product [Heterobilharzia americana]
MDFFCSCCDVKMNSSAQMAAHIRGRKHQSKAASCSIDSPVRSATAMSDDTESESVFYRCDDCQAVLFTSAKAEHLASAEHRSNACGRNRRALSIGPSVKNLLHLRKYQRSCREALTPVWSSVTFTGLEARLLEEAAKGDDDCVIHLDSLGGGRSRVGLHLAHALLAANRNPSSTSFLDNPSSKCMPTCIVWIVPTVQEPSSGFSSVFKLLPNIEESSTERRLIFAYPPLDMETVFQTDVILTSPDSFVKYVSKLVMQQRFVCGIIIENVDLVSKDREFVKLLCNYLQVYTDQVNRGR